MGLPQRKAAAQEDAGRSARRGEPGGTEVGSRAEPKAGAGGERGANRGGTRTQTDAKEVRRKEPDCQPDWSEKGRGTGTKTFRNGVENDLKRSRGPRGGRDTGRPTCAAPS